MRHEYRIVRGDSEDLSIAVTNALADGWELWGNPFAVEIKSIYQIGTSHDFCQAMVRQVENMQEKASASHAADAADGGSKPPQLEPAGYTVGVPEMPEFSEARTGTANLKVIQFFPTACTCFEKVGDNLNCPVHRTSVPSGRLS
jgi:hypothetical protein